MNVMTEIENEPEVDSFDALDLSPVMRRALEQSRIREAITDPIEIDPASLGRHGCDRSSADRNGQDGRLFDSRFSSNSILSRNAAIRKRS